MTAKVYSHIVDQSLTKKLCVVDVGANYIRSRNTLTAMRTPNF